MKIISYGSGALIALFPMDAFAPLVSINERNLMDEIRHRYRFGAFPNVMVSQDELGKSGLVFESGEHETPNGSVPVNRLAIHNDGIVVRSSTTERAEGIFEDLKEWLISERNFRRVPINALYTSELVVDFEKPLSKAFKDLNKILDVVTRKMPKNRKLESSHLGGFAIEFESPTKPPKFLIERRIGVPADQERYFCQAPMPTAAHIGALKEIERLL